MFGIFGTQWKVTKAVDELVAIAGDRATILPDMRDQTVKNVLEFSHDLRMASTRLSPDEQAMITRMAMYGTMGPAAFNDAASWCRSYAGRHAVASTIVEECQGAAADSVQRME